MGEAGLLNCMFLFLEVFYVVCLRTALKISPGFGCLEDVVPRSPAPRMTGSWVDCVWAAGSIHAGWVWRPWRLQLCRRLGRAGGESPGQACGNCRSRSDSVCGQQAWREAGTPPGEQRQQPGLEVSRAVALSGVDSGAEGGGVWTSEGMSTVTLYREWPSRCDK